MVSFVADDTHRGTPEAAWRAHLAGCGLPLLELGAVARVVVVAPHPDDEVLGVGGLLRALHARGVELAVLAVTDGEGSHPDDDPAAAGARRRREAHAADAALGIAPRRHHLGLPDGQVEAHELTLRAALDGLVGPLDLVLAPWERDGHPDHDACGRAATAAASATGADLLAYPVWAWHWATPEDGALPLGRASIHPLSTVDRAAKGDAVAAFTSQLTARPGGDAVLGASVVARFTRPYEVVLHP